MTESTQGNGRVVVVTGANGFVGGHVCAALVRRGVTVRAVVRRAGTAPQVPEVEEHVGAFDDPAFASVVCTGAEAAVSTVHPLGSDRASQHRTGVLGTAAFARSARDAGVSRLAHVSTAAVYDRSPGVGDVDEASALVGDDADDYAVTKRDADLALAEVDGLTRVLARPPAILGPGPTSFWNAVRPAEMRGDERERCAVADQTFAWVHVDDLAALLAEAATGGFPAGGDPSAGPVAGGCTPVNVCAGSATVRAYTETVTRALGVAPVWEERPAWQGRLLADRAHAWGWSPSVDLDDALAELDRGLRRRP